MLNKKEKRQTRKKKMLNQKENSWEMVQTHNKIWLSVLKSKIIFGENGRKWIMLELLPCSCSFHAQMLVDNHAELMIPTTCVLKAAKAKHRKNCKCCPLSLLIVRQQRLSRIKVLNCRNCKQCLKCHKSAWFSCVAIVTAHCHTQCRTGSKKKSCYIPWIKSGSVSDQVGRWVGRWVGG